MRHRKGSVMTEDLTERQREILRYLHDFIVDRGYPPTVREIGSAMQIRSTNGVNDHLLALERRGWITRSENKSRTTKLTDAALALFLEGTLDAADAGSEAAAPARWHGETVDIPMLGQIAAGEPLDATEADAWVRFDRTLLGRGSDGEVFALQVRGDSMIEDGVLDGDTLFVRRQREARNGEMVALWLEGGATVKRYFAEGDSVRLQPANAAMQATVVSSREARDLLMIGKVVGLFRRVS